MSRLYYEPVVAPQPEGQLFRRKFEIKDSTSTKLFLEKVAKLVPSEIIAGYVALVGIIPLVRNEDAHPWLFGGVALICLVLTPIYLNLQAETGKPKRNHLILSTVAFMVWAYAVSGGIVIPQWHDPAIASILLVLFSLVSGAVPLNK